MRAADDPWREERSHGLLGNFCSSFCNSISSWSLFFFYFFVDCIMKPILGGTEGDLSTPVLCSKSVLDHESSHSPGMHIDKSTENQLLDRGYLEYGCTHNRKRCRIRAPCCNEIFDCHFCHDDESKNNPDKDGHKMPRKAVRQVICSLCNTEQEFQQICINCGVCMGRYICGICKVLNDDPSRKIKHCLSCGVCRQGKPEHQIIHCNKCQCCRENPHTCIEGGLLHRKCPICFESLFTTKEDMSAMPCGHVIHHPCFPELMKSPNTCPICSKMSGRNTTWRLQLHRFLRIFKTNCFGSFAMIAAPSQ